jgi:hypothetical protein
MQGPLRTTQDEAELKLAKHIQKLVCSAESKLRSNKLIHSAKRPPTIVLLLREYKNWISKIEPMENPIQIVTVLISASHLLRLNPVQRRELFRQLAAYILCWMHFPFDWRSDGVYWPRIMQEFGFHRTKSKMLNATTVFVDRRYFPRR